jgi:hypothetical protein
VQAKLALGWFEHVQSLLTSADATAGRSLFTERVGLGNVFASPVADGPRDHVRSQGRGIPWGPRSLFQFTPR